MTSSSARLLLSVIPCNPPLERPHSMKISNPSSLPADIRVVVTYTIEAGDPREFFFEVVDNGRRNDIDNKQPFSGSGSFFTIPGDIGPHFIEAYNSTSVVGLDQPFAVGPTYTVLPPLSSSTTVFAPTSAIPVPNSPTNTLQPTVATQPTSKLPQNTPTPTTTTTTTPDTPLLPAPNLSNSILKQNATSTAAPSATTLYESGLGGITTVKEVLSQTPSTPSGLDASSSNVSFSGNRNSVNLRAIIGATVAGTVAVAIILILLIRRFKRRNPGGSRESAVRNSAPAIDPFLGFAARPNEKAWRNYIRLDYSTRNTTSVTSSPTSDETSSTWTEGASRKDGPNISREIRGQQMEWVLRPTHDPPPEYNSRV
ncbi:hypothetical protein K438DRAFT_2013399 [Mycena galopus ATCC 62051]|nr:hypothetical protein K438DRAFT_2013399 [Mycena galopus ATCC 62051]